jgi:hypothetical protein
MTSKILKTKPVIDDDIEWYCDNHKIIVKHTGKVDWAFCHKCGTHIHAIKRTLHQVTTYKTAFCHAKVLIDDISKDGYAACSICKSLAEPVFEDIKSILEEV